MTINNYARLSRADALPTIDAIDSADFILAVRGNSVLRLPMDEVLAAAGSPYLDEAHFDGNIADLIAYAAANEIVEARVDRILTPTGDLVGRSNVVFRGTGSFVGVNQDTAIYRRQVIPDDAPVARGKPDPFYGVTPKSTVNVVLVGDSLTTYGANSLSASDTLAEKLKRKLIQDNPDVTINFFSRGIGGQTFGTIDTVPSVSYTITDRYPWYTDPDRAWLDYVEDLDPDIVILSSGMNDAEGFDRVDLESVVAKIEAMPTGPRVAFCTNMVPNLAPDAAFSQFGTYLDQEGRDSVAGWVRTYCLYHEYPLIDINRTFNMVRDGRDILDTYLIEADAVSFGSASRFLADADQACRDFSIRAEVTADGWSNAKPFAVALADDGVNSDATNNAVFISDNAGFLRFKFYRGGFSSLYKDETSTIATPSTTVTVEISVRNGQFAFRIYPTTAGEDAGVQPYTSKIIRYGGLFRPEIYYFGDSTNGPVLSATLFYGVERQYQPTITDLDLWGVPSASSGDRDVTGGNGINHPTSEGAAAVYDAHFASNTYTLDNGESEAPAGQEIARWTQTDDSRALRLIAPSAPNGVWKWATNDAFEWEIDSTTVAQLTTERFNLQSAAINLASYTVAELAGLSGVAQRDIVFVTDGDSGSPCLAVYNVANWLRVPLGAPVSSS